jgi:hypothetical protein
VLSIQDENVIKRECGQAARSTVAVEEFDFQAIGWKKFQNGAYVTNFQGFARRAIRNCHKIEQLWLSVCHLRFLPPLQYEARDQSRYGLVAADNPGASSVARVHEINDVTLPVSVVSCRNSIALDRCMW